MLLAYGYCSANACEVVKLNVSGRDESGYVPEPGIYCLTRDLRHAKVLDLHSLAMKSFTGKGLLTLMGRQPGQARQPTRYEVDFGGHIMSADADDMRGVTLTGRINGAHLFNGKIIVPGSGRPNAGIYLPAYDIDGFRPTGISPHFGPWEPEYEDVPFAALQDKRKPGYAATGNVVHKMDIRAGYRGIVLGGGNNVIRNSRIEVDGNTAIYVYGPGTIIENNTIIVHGKGESVQWDAAIKLRDADNAIVRNNRIIFDGTLFEKGEAAINLLDSDNVTIDGNTITGYRKNVRVNGVSTFTENTAAPSR